jgi:uncharacterized protein YxeA
MAQVEGKSDTKKKLTATVLAVVLAVTAIIGGGTYAYLKDDTEEVVNEFKTNKISVELDETTGDKYNIVPGTSQSKDPTVTIDNSVDAYLFVEVKDNTDGLVEYEIADGWTKVNNIDKVVYFRRVAADADVKEFSVLKDNTVTYSADLENSDMVDENGNLIDDVALTINAFAVENDFDYSYSAYMAAKDVLIETESQLDLAAYTEAPIKLGADITIKNANIGIYIQNSDPVVIDLNGYTLTISESFYSGVSYSDGTVVNENITLKNGNVIVNDSGILVVGSNSSLTLDNVVLDSYVSHTIFANGQDATVTIVDSTINQIEGGMTISTNATTSDNYNPVITIDNSTINCEYTDGWTSSAVFINVPAQVTINDSTIIGEKHAVAMRCGTATITNSTLSRPYAITQSEEDMFTTATSWSGNGNDIPFATLLIGNRYDDLTYYNNPASVTLDNVTITAYDENGVQGKTVYMYGNTEDTIAQLTYNGSNCTVGDIVQANENTVVTVK